MRGIKDKIAVVTGGTRGIGRGIAQRLADEGAKLVIVGTNMETAEKTAREMRLDGADVEEIMQNKVERWPGLS